MATLTEKETEVKYGNISGRLYAEYSDGKCRDIYATITVDEAYDVKWSISHSHGQIRLWDDLRGFTSDWKIAVSVLNTDFMLKLRKEIDKLTETR